MSSGVSRRYSLSLLFLFCFPLSVAAQRLPPLEQSQGESRQQSSAPPLRLADSISPSAALSLGPASRDARDQIAAMEAYNRVSDAPPQIGFSRPLGIPITFDASRELAQSPSRSDLTVRATSANSLVWGTAVRVEGAGRLRLHLADVLLPATARLWVWSQTDRPVEFGLELLSPEGDLWTPSVGGDTIRLEAEISAPSSNVGRFQVTEVAEIRSVEIVKSSAAIHCVGDATCISPSAYDAIEDLRRSVAHLQFMRGGRPFRCTGNLLNNTREDFTPYLLTANHCISTQAEASTLEAFWDYRTSICRGAFPNLSSSPRSNGAIQLTTGSASDFTLLRLFNIPPGRAFLGWDADPYAVGQGTLLFRVSHPGFEGLPEITPQSYAVTSVETTLASCPGLPRPSNIYSIPEFSAAYRGSSGAAVCLPGGVVVGQLRASCPPIISDPCTELHRIIDGAFSETFPLIAQWLSPGIPQTCTTDPTTLCLNGNRFRVSATWQTSTASGQAQAVRLTPDTGYFWFFNASNVEMVTKVLNACAVNNRHWVFAGGLTNVAVTLTVTDTQTGAVRSYFNPSGTAYQPIQDTSAFATCP